MSGSNLVTSTRGVEGTAQAHSAGAVVEILVTSKGYNDIIDHLLVGHSQLGAHKFTQVVDTNGNETLKLGVTASAVNEITVINASTGAFPTIQATGEADTGIDFENSENEEILKLDAIASAVNEITIKNAAVGNPPIIEMSGGDTNIDLKIVGKGTGVVKHQVSVVLIVVAPTTDTATGDGKLYFVIPPEVNGMVLSAVFARVITAGTTNTTDIQLHNVTDAVDILSTKMTIDSTETSTATAATPAVINTSNDDMATNDLIRVDVDAVSTTAAKGLILRLTFGF